MVDVGMRPGPPTPVDRNFYEYAERHDTFDLLVGEDFGGLANMWDKANAGPPKLVAPQFRFVTRGAAALSPVHQERFAAVQSFAQGGLANAWGAGLYEYDDRDLERFPVSRADLEPFYVRLTREIGISGVNDDLERFFGRGSRLQAPLTLSRNARFLLERYRKHRAELNRRGFFLGRPRLGVLTEEKDGRRACAYDNLEFWSPHQNAIYTPRYTLEQLVARDALDYESGYLVKSWRRRGAVLEVLAWSPERGEHRTFSCETLVLAAGAINSAKIVLASRGDTETRLGLMDNGAFQFPFFLVPRIGARLETDAFGLTQLNLVCEPEGDGRRHQASLLELTGPARAEFFGYFPLAARSSLSMIKYFLPSMMVMQLFLPAFERCADLSLAGDGGLDIRGREKPEEKRLIRTMVRFLRRLGAVSHPSLVTNVNYGHGIHYAGTLPMRAEPRSPYECDAAGRLHGEPGVYVVDGAAFPVLPAKNFSFTMMANAMRISAGIAAAMGG